MAAFCFFRLAHISSIRHVSLALIAVLRMHIAHGFLPHYMAANASDRPNNWILALTACALAALIGCYSSWWSGTEHYDAPDSAVGEEHVINYSTADALQLTEDALRGDGILFEVQPDNSIVTLWRNADFGTPKGFLSNLSGSQPRYRYEIQFNSEASQRTKIIVNVRTEGISDDEVAKYKAGNRFALFKEIDELALKYPPPSHLPASGGVNFALLPNEDLKALAKRVTGNSDNWAQIAKDNGLKSDTDVTAFQNVWVRNNLLPPVR